MTEQDPTGTNNDWFGISKVHFCPDCKKPLRRREGKMGPFWSCSGFPACHTTLDDVDGKPSNEPDEHYCCPVCTRRMVRIQSDGDRLYWLCTGASRGCNVRLRDDLGRPEVAYRCGSCGHLLVKRHGRHGSFWGCSGFPQCKQTYNDKEGKPDIRSPSNG